ncbi:hypothetical protein [Ktedonospora formicarum]|uniref:Uncharacterized protein n=1 Tax=Ktedonospora formicarum TaxID=2778364 RepID=A0A8J3MN45_9CHLR|nr:hypothetical protein [Ktedonospora formicarum]GHO42312.1 hypothetical protein KSX_04750 [Ktedonospora formicarum]
MQLVTHLGSFFAKTTVVHVGDREADMFPFFQACQAMQTHFLVRAFENRRLKPEEGLPTYLLDACEPGHRRPANPLRRLAPMDERLA